ncbi:hypothetical protein [Nocardioides pakistanensis]
MSTKIYHGYRLAAGVDLFDFVDHVRRTMNPIRDRLDARALIGGAVRSIDGADLGGRPRPGMPLFDAMSAYDDLQRKTGPDSRLHDPHRFELAIGRDKPSGRMLVLLYADRPEYVEAWEALPQVEPYGYWNNADQPEDVTDAEWDERREAWDRVMPGYTPPVACMASVALRADSDMGMFSLVQDTDKHRDLLLGEAPTLRDRAANAAGALLARAARDAGEPDSDILRRFVFRRAPGHLVDLVEPLLDPYAPEAALTKSQDEQPVREVDLGPVRDAIRELL